MKLITITGRAYPSPNNYMLFVMALISIFLVIFSGVNFKGWETFEGYVVAIMVAFLFISALVAPFVERNELLEVFTQHIQPPLRNAQGRNKE